MKTNHRPPEDIHPYPGLVCLLLVAIALVVGGVCAAGVVDTIVDISKAANS